MLLKRAALHNHSPEVLSSLHRKTRYTICVYLPILFLSVTYSNNILKIVIKKKKNVSIYKLYSK